MSVLAIDCGTTGVTALVVGEDAQVLSRGYQEFGQHFPVPGWVEHEPEEIWAAVIASCRAALDGHTGLDGHAVQAVGITNQRETAVFWDRRTLQAPRKAIVWQDRRTTGICEQLRSDGHEPRVAELTGLRLDPYFTATKLSWVRQRDARTWAGVEGGSTAVGTVDSYVVARLTGGARHVTDASNASRTLLFDIHRGDWDDELLALLDVPRAVLPAVVASSGVCAEATIGAARVPIAGIAGDQQAALFGQACLERGMAKNTYGTGCFLLLNTGTSAVASSNHLVSTIAWKRDGRLDYALEGSVFIAGAVVQWLRDGLKIVRSAAEIEALAASAPDNGGVYLVPAFAGLGAPHWDAYARGAMFGLTRGSTAAHIARAALESIAYQSAEVLRAMEADAGLALAELRVDGGATANNLLMQFQADLLGVPVVRPNVQETTALGAAYLAGLATGYWKNTDDIRANWRIDRRFEPAMSRDQAAALTAGWDKAVARAKGWA